MVEGRTLSATVVDLDGTLVSRNTFVEFSKYAFRLLLRRRHFAAALRLAGWIVLRQTRAISHRRMKFHILASSAPHLSEADIERFAERAELWADIDVIDRMTNEIVILATAAPQLYADAVGRRFGIEHVVATRSAPTLRAFVECRGEEKLRRVRDVLSANNAELVRVITDHDDDRPLMDANPTGDNIIVRR